MATEVVSNREMVDSGRYEFVHGRLIKRALPGLKHATLQQRMVDLLRPQVALTGKVVLAELSLDQTALDQTDRARSEWLTPDVPVSTSQGFITKANNDHALPPAFLAIEILSPGQTFMNLRWKADHYIQWGVQHVWFLDPESASVLTYAAPDSSRGQMLSSGTVAVDDQVSLALSDIFV